MHKFDSQKQRLLFTESPRTPHLYRIWKALSGHETLPQVDRWLAQYFRGEKRFGKKDRQWYADAMFAAYRFGPLVVHLEQKFVAPFALSSSQNSWQLLAKVPVENLFHWLSLLMAPFELAAQKDPEKANFLQAERQDLFQSLDLADQLIAYGIPSFYAQSLKQRLSQSQWSREQLQTFLRFQVEKAPLWVRVNRSADAGEARRQLQEAGAEIEEHGDAWKVISQKNIQTLPCMEQGSLEIQDLASQRIGAAVPLAGEPLVWDCCAGGGGKTLQIATRLRGNARVYASDIRSYKLAEVERRAQRAGLKRVETLAWNGDQLPNFPKEWTRQGGVDIILIDAPCTGTGTWRRSPDSKFRCDEGSIKELQDLQKSLFSKVLPALKKGGCLVYATCSWLPEENEDIIAAAVFDHPELFCESQQLCGNPAEDSDTMFYAVLRKKI